VPDDLALAAALGRVYFELEMLDEAPTVSRSWRCERRTAGRPRVPGRRVRAPRRCAAAFDEYRRALRLGHAFDWPHRCTPAAATAPTWQDRCPQCQRWNTLRPSPAR
jgi:hypothetical protein